MNVGKSKSTAETIEARRAQREKQYRERLAMRGQSADERTSKERRAALQGAVRDLANGLEKAGTALSREVSSGLSMDPGR